MTTEEPRKRRRPRKFGGPDRKAAVHVDLDEEHTKRLDSFIKNKYPAVKSRAEAVRFLIWRASKT